MQAVDIGVRREDDLLVAEPLDAVGDVQRAHEVEELLVLVDRVALEVAGVERLAAQREDGLVVRLARLGERAGGGEALADEDHRVESLALGGVEMGLAVLELADADRDGLGALARRLLDVVELAAQVARVLDLLDELLRGGGVAVEQLDDGLLDGRHEVGADLGVAELVLRLRLEDRVLELDRHGADEALAHVVAVELRLGRILVDGLEDAFAEGGEVRAAVVGELAVDEREVLLREAVRVGEGELERLVAEVERLVELLELDFVVEQVQQAVLGAEGDAVVDDREAGVEVGVEADAPFDVLRVEFVAAEDLRIGLEHHLRAVALVRPALRLLDDRAALEAHLGVAAVAHGAGLETRGEGVDGLGADAVHADGELEDVVVELAARVHVGDAGLELAERDAAAVVAAGDDAAVERDLHALAEARDEFVDRVVDDFLEEHVDAVVVVVAVAEAADVHAGPQSDVFERGELLDRVLVVDALSGGGLAGFCHGGG